MLMITQRLVNWAAQECEWQQSGERSVAWLIQAHQEAFVAYQEGEEITEDLIKTLGAIIEPGRVDGYRQVGVSVGLSIKPDWREVPRLMTQLVEWGRVPLTPSDWYREFEEIHPFVDGNGRTGAILFNWLNGTLHPDKIVYPPNLWFDGRREPDYGPLGLD